MRARMKMARRAGAYNFFRVRVRVRILFQFFTLERLKQVCEVTANFNFNFTGGGGGGGGERLHDYTSRVILRRYFLRLS